MTGPKPPAAPAAPAAGGNGGGGGKPQQNPQVQIINAPPLASAHDQDNVCVVTGVTVD